MLAETGHEVVVASDVGLQTHKQHLVDQPQHHPWLPTMRMHDPDIVSSHIRSVPNLDHLTPHSLGVLNHSLLVQTIQNGRVYDHVGFEFSERLEGRVRRPRFAMRFDQDAVGDLVRDDVVFPGELGKEDGGEDGVEGEHRARSAGAALELLERLDGMIEHPSPAAGGDYGGEEAVAVGGRGHLLV